MASHPAGSAPPPADPEPHPPQESTINVLGEVRRSSVPPPPPRRRKEESTAAGAEPQPTPIAAPPQGLGVGAEPSVPAIETRAAEGVPRSDVAVEPRSPVNTAPPYGIDDEQLTVPRLDAILHGDDAAQAGVFPVIPRLDPPPRADGLPVIPRLDANAASRDQRDTIPPAGRATTSPSLRRTTIRSPSEILQAQSAPAPDGSARARFWEGLTANAARLRDVARERLPSLLRERDGVSTAAIATAGGLGLLFVVGVGAAIASLSSSTTPEPSSGAPAPSALEPATAAAATSPTTSEAAQNAPATPKAPAASGPGDEAAILLELAESLLAQHRDAEVLPVVERLVTRRPDLKSDERVGRLLLATSSSNDRQAAQASYSLLTGPMGEAGAGLLYELSLKRDVREGVRTRAQNWLSGKDFERTAALPLYAAVKLRNAANCEDKHALLDFAGKAGGKYVLEYMKELDRKRVCAPDDLEHCYPCMNNDNRLADTIKKLEQR